MQQKIPKGKRVFFRFRTSSRKQFEKPWWEFLSTLLTFICLIRTSKFKRKCENTCILANSTFLSFGGARKAVYQESYNILFESSLDETHLAYGKANDRWTRIPDSSSSPISNPSSEMWKLWIILKFVEFRIFEFWTVRLFSEGQVGEKHRDNSPLRGPLAPSVSWPVPFITYLSRS